MTVKQYILRLLLFLSPAILLLGFYILDDPFKVIRHYSVFAEGDTAPTGLNKDYCSTELFLNNYPIRHYNSFIFGNSRSIFYRVKVWQKYIHSDRYFHFDASGESLLGVDEKVKLISNKGVKIDNALFVFDYDLLSLTGDREGHLYIKHPALSGQSPLLFQMEFLKDFLDFKFLVSYLDFKINHKYNRFFKNVMNDRKISWDVNVNEESWPAIDSLLKFDSATYYNLHQSAFYRRDTLQQYSPRIIWKDQKILLEQIHNILLRDSAQYRIVISPLYNQNKFDSTDLCYLKSLFGESNVFDFSGINAITNNVHNYYENSHYREHVAASIIQQIYSKR